MGYTKKSNAKLNRTEQEFYEDLLRSVGPDVFKVHDERIPPGHYWLGREYTITVCDEFYRFEWRSLKHRVNGPALVWFDGSREEWFLFDKHHRVGGPAITRKEEGGQHLVYMEHGRPHRYGGPAILDAYSGEQWFWHGRLHREDGPALTRHDGDQAYYIDGGTTD